MDNSPVDDTERPSMFNGSWNPSREMPDYPEPGEGLMGSGLLVKSKPLVYAKKDLNVWFGILEREDWWETRVRGGFVVGDFHRDPDLETKTMVLRVVVENRQRYQSQEDWIDIQFPPAITLSKVDDRPQPVLLYGLYKSTLTMEGVEGEWPCRIASLARDWSMPDDYVYHVGMIVPRGRARHQIVAVGNDGPLARMELVVA